MSAALRRIHSQHPLSPFYSRCLSRKQLYNSPLLSSQSQNFHRTSSTNGSDETGSTSETGEARRRPKKQKEELQTATIRSIQKHVERFTDIDPRSDVTLEDIERYRLPSNRQELNPRSPYYEQFFKQSLEQLTQSFSVPQLQQFIRMYGLAIPRQRNKTALATYILEKKWDYPSLEKIKEEQMDWTEQDERCINTSGPGHSFLLLGKDGRNILDLSKRYDVYLAFTPNPMSLRVKGFRGSVKQIEGYLANFKKDIALETCYLPLKEQLSTEMEQTISRLSGAYVQVADDLKVSITYLKNNAEAVQNAKRLITEAATKDIVPAVQGVYFPDDISDNSTESFTHSLYPFSPLHTLPWQTSSGSAFRYRRVGKWRDVSKYPIPSSVNTLPNNIGTVLTTENTEMDLKILLSNTKKTTVVTASPGHYLFFSSTNNPANIVPPMTGARKPNEILSWLKENAHRPYFSPSIPNFLAPVIPYDEGRNIRRVIYRCQDSAKSGINNYASDIPLTLIFENIEKAETNTSITETGDSTLSLDHVSFSEISQNVVDLLVPDRQNDLRVVSELVDKLPSHNIPKEMKSYISALSSEWTPHVPLTLTHRRQKYVLDSHQRVYQTFKSYKFNEEMSGRFINENIIDLDSGYNTTVSKLVCEASGSDDAWINFSRICNWLTKSQ